MRALASGGEPYDLANLRTICRRCHFDAHAPKLPFDVQAWKDLMADGS